MVRSVVVVVEVTLNKQARPVRYGLIDGRVLAWVAERPECCRASGEAAVQAIRLEESNQFASVLDKPWLDMVPIPGRMVPVNVPRKNSAR